MSPSPRDLAPASRRLAQTVLGLDDHDLTRPTPSAAYRVGDLLEHVEGLSTGLRLTARKEEVPDEDLRDGDASQLRAGWRERIPVQLSELATAWADPAAWEGDTVQGGVPLPAAASGMFVLNELLVHGWELAVATGQPCALDVACEADAAAVSAFLKGFEPPDDEDGGTEGIFGDPVPVPDDAPPLDRLLGLTGRDPGWRPG